MQALQQTGLQFQEATSGNIRRRELRMGNPANVPVETGSTGGERGLFAAIHATEAFDIS